MLKPFILLSLLLSAPALAQSSSSVFSSSNTSSSESWDDSDIDVDFPEFPAIPAIPPIPAIPTLPPGTPGSSSSSSASCSGGTCTVTINGQTKTYPGNSVSLQVGNTNGQTHYQVIVDGKLVDQG
jgi:hypothetical protein